MIEAAATANTLPDAAQPSEPVRRQSGHQLESSSSSRGRGYTFWSAEEDALLKSRVQESDPVNWNLIAQGVPGRDQQSCKERSARSSAHTVIQSNRLQGARFALLQWLFGTQCTHTACRWCNCLAPGLELGPFDSEEDRTIIRAHAEVGNQWSRIAQQLPGRTAHRIKCRWRSAELRRLQAAEGLPAGDHACSRADPDHSPPEHHPNTVEEVSLSSAMRCLWSQEYPRQSGAQSITSSFRYVRSLA